MTRDQVRPASITTADVDRYHLLRRLLSALHRDIQELAKKKQDGALTKTRIAMINRLLKDVKEFLAAEPSANYLDILDEDAVPQNADALLIAGQYLSAMDQFQSRYTHYVDYKFKWITGQDIEQI